MRSESFSQTQLSLANIPRSTFRSLFTYLDFLLFLVSILDFSLEVLADELANSRSSEIFLELT